MSPKGFEVRIHVWPISFSEPLLCMIGAKMGFSMVKKYLSQYNLCSEHVNVHIFVMSQLDVVIHVWPISFFDPFWGMLGVKMGKVPISLQMMFRKRKFPHVMSHKELHVCFHDWPILFSEPMLGMLGVKRGVRRVKKCPFSYKWCSEQVNFHI